MNDVVSYTLRCGVRLLIACLGHDKPYAKQAGAKLREDDASGITLER